MISSYAYMHQYLHILKKITYILHTSFFSLSLSWVWFFISWFARMLRQQCCHTLQRVDLARPFLVSPAIKIEIGNSLAMALSKAKSGSAWQSHFWRCLLKLRQFWQKRSLQQSHFRGRKHTGFFGLQQVVLLSTFWGSKKGPFFVILFCSNFHSLQALKACFQPALMCFVLVSMVLRHWS